ncbi:MAG: hypothetical protein IJK64_00535 [Clostridia bacterium]|nr:hypothetical protein [Clostridia bacterium]
MKTLKKRLAVLLCACMLFVCAVPGSAGASAALPMLLLETESNGGYLNYHLTNAATGAQVTLPSAAAPGGPRRAEAQLPTAYDARTAGVVTGVRNQGETGACWAFSTLAALESDAIAGGIADLTADYSEAHLAWFANHSLVTDTADGTCGDDYTVEEPYMTGGNWLIATSELSRWGGIARESSFPYAPYSASTMGNYAAADRYTTDSGAVLRSAEELSSAAAVKQWIQTHGAVTATIYIDDVNYEYNGAYYYNGTESPNHQITLIGWDDSYSAANFKPGCRPAVNGAWLVKDSWGTYFHNRGYFWLSYADVSLCNTVGFTAQSTEAYQYNYTYNGAGWNASLTPTGNSKVANVFRAKSKELLQAVAFYTVMPAQTVTISVYSLYSSYNSPVRGSPLLTQTLTLTNAGYHTVDLNSAISLASGSYFSVVIEYAAMYNSDYNASIAVIPVEYNGVDDGRTYASQSKQSYAYIPSFSGNNSWYQLSAFDSGLCNVCVQALTSCDHAWSVTQVDATCEADGYTDAVCSLCGKETHTVLPATGHSYGDWSAYAYAGAGVRETHRTCGVCGHVESQTISTGARFITLQQLLERLFTVFQTALRQLR